MGMFLFAVCISFIIIINIIILKMKGIGKIRYLILAICIALFTISFVLLKMQINTQKTSIKVKNPKNISNKISAEDENSLNSKGVNSIINNNTLNISFINNGSSGCILIKYNEKNILVDCGKSDEINNIKNSLKGHMIDKINELILTTTDKDSIGAAPELIKEYNISNILYINDSIKENIAFNDIEKAANLSGASLKKINEKFNIEDAIISTSVNNNNSKLNFKFPQKEDTFNIRTLSFVKDSFDNSIKTGMHHDLSLDCDSDGNINVNINAYYK